MAVLNDLGGSFPVVPLVVVVAAVADQLRWFVWTGSVGLFGWLGNWETAACRWACSDGFETLRTSNVLTRVIGDLEATAGVLTRF